MDGPKFLSVRASTGPFPYNLIPKVSRPKHGVHDALDVVARCRVEVDIDTARVLEHPLHFDQPNPEETQERPQVFAMGVFSRLDHFHQRPIGVADVVHPRAVDVFFPPPLVNVFAADALAVAPRVERRVRGDQVDDGRIHAAQGVEVVHVVDGAEDDVEGHGETSLVEREWIG